MGIKIIFLPMALVAERAPLCDAVLIHKLLRLIAPARRAQKIHYTPHGVLETRAKHRSIHPTERLAWLAYTHLTPAEVRRVKKTIRASLLAISAQKQRRTATVDAPVVFDCIYCNVHGSGWVDGHARLLVVANGGSILRQR